MSFVSSFLQGLQPGTGRQIHLVHNTLFEVNRRIPTIMGVLVAIRAALFQSITKVCCAVTAEVFPIPPAFSIVIQLRAASSRACAAVPMRKDLLEQAWEPSVLPLSQARPSNIDCTHSCNLGTTDSFTE